MTLDRQQLIRARAYAIWEENGHPDGKALAHWLQAESEVDSAKVLLRQIRDATFTSNRAFVVMHTIDPQFIGEKATHTITSWKFTFRWGNVGNTPTKYMTTWINSFAAPMTPEPTFDFPDRGDPLEIHHTTLAPKALMQKAAETTIAVDVLEKIRSGELHAYFWGWADYNDVFPNTPRHRSEFCYEMIVNGDVRAEDCKFLFRPYGRYNAFDEECLREPRLYASQGDEQIYKFMDAGDIDRVLVDGTIKVSSFKRFRDQETTEWGDIADRLEGASELTIKESLVATENSPELEMLNKANIGLGMFTKNFIELGNGGIASFGGNMSFVHQLPNLFIYSASFGKLAELTSEMCVKARRRYNACVRVISLAELQRRVFSEGRIRGLNRKVSEVFTAGSIQLVKYEARSREIHEGGVPIPSPFIKDVRFRPQAEVRMLFIPKEGVNVPDEIIIEVPGAKSLFSGVFRQYPPVATV
jgi:hypothetical protein